MKTLIQKELRENFKIAAIGFLLAVVVVVSQQVYYIDLIESITAGFSMAHKITTTASSRLRPIISASSADSPARSLASPSAGFKFTANAIATSGPTLSIVPLRVPPFSEQSDRRASRSTCSLSAFPLPISSFGQNCPARLPRPLNGPWRQKSSPLFFSGFAWYFAGMLTSIRQARWYGSRALGLVAAFMMTLLIYSDQVKFWLAALILLTLVFAVWGAFHNRGQFQGQPAAGKVALTLALAPGAGLAVLASVALLMEVIPGLNSNAIPARYALGQDGRIYKITQSKGSAQIVTLDGEQLKDPDTGRPMEIDKFNRGFSSGGITANVPEDDITFGGQSDWFRLFFADSHMLWFFMNGSKRIEGYDVQSRRFIGSIGPDGFAINKTGDGSQFLNDGNRWQYYGGFDDIRQTVASANSLYEVDLGNRTAKPLWTTGAADPILGISKGNLRQNTVVLTRTNIHFFHLTGTAAMLVWSIPSTYPVHDYPSVSVHQFGNYQAKGPYTVWFDTSWAPFEAKTNLPVHVLRLDKDGAIAKQQDLPPLERVADPRITEHVLGAIMPPAIGLSAPWWINAATGPKKIEWSDLSDLSASFTLSFVCVIAGFLLGRRYSFTARQQTIWAVYHLFFGIPGLLAFVAVQEWPARERCPGCGKLRIVQNESCEHCGVGFSAPKKNGTEIFEALETV